MRKIVGLIACVLVFFACNKEETPKLIEKIDLISGEFYKDWYIKNATITFTDESKLLPKVTPLKLDCEIDDKWVFYRNGILEIHDQLTKCKGTVELKTKTTWTPDDTFTNFAFGEFKLGGVTNSNNVKFTVSELSDSTMTITAKNIQAKYEAFEVKFVTLK